MSFLDCFQIIIFFLFIVGSVFMLICMPGKLQLEASVMSLLYQTQHKCFVFQFWVSRVFFFSGNSRVPVSLPFPASRSCLSSYLCFCHHIFFCFFYYIREIIPSMCNTTAVNLEIWTTEIVFEVVDKVSIFNQKYLHVIIVILLVEEILENVIWTESDDSRCKAWDTRGND